MADTKIEWTDKVWNVTRGCSRVSSGCTRCYAERVAARFSGEGLPYHGLAEFTPSGPRWTGRVELIEKKLSEPLSWRKPRRIFVNSMSDLFHEKLSFDDIRKVFSVMYVCHATNRGHVFQILTKRPERMREFIEYRAARLREEYGPAPLVPDVLPNVWLGVSVEDQATADERIPLLLQTPAAVRFISAEPLLGPVDLRPWLSPVFRSHWTKGYVPTAQDRRAALEVAKAAAAGHPLLDWVIVGGESGPGARPFSVEWARRIVRECDAAGVPVFVKQLGADVRDRNDAGFDGADSWSWPEMDPDDIEDDPDRTGDRGYQGARVRIRLRDRKGGDPEEWPEDLRVRKFPHQAAPA